MSRPRKAQRKPRARYSLKTETYTGAVEVQTFSDFGAWLAAITNTDLRDDLQKVEALKLAT
ncbi:hypothetical protein [Ruegeria atlantica]|uniref:hypothetical protein n=1 Tax=Ruegeria atlantica TaxID=81569 RepID=UPI00147F6985|nr:hypothetical protein [Ruegeria atlantica]